MSDTLDLDPDFDTVTDDDLELTDQARLDKQFAEWQKTSRPKPLRKEDVRAAVVDALGFSKSLNPKEYTLWRTWDQINTEFDPTDEKLRAKLRRIKRTIWNPRKPEDYLDLEPELIFVQGRLPIPNVGIWGTERFDFLSNPDPLSDDWEILRHFVSSMEHGGSIGRSMRFIVRDRIRKKYLGILCLSSDFADLKGRDDLIGWTQKQRTDPQSGMLNHVAIGSVIVPTQPFGYDYVGGKLLSLLLVSDVVAKTWERLYGDKLVGVTTTSLYGHEGTGSQYSGLNPQWKSLGHTAGSATVRPDRKTEELMKGWLEYAHPRFFWEYFKAQSDTGMPLRRNANECARRYCYKDLGLSTEEITSSHQRGIYFSHLYENSFQFLRREITESSLVPRFDNSVDHLVKIWREKHARKRIENLDQKGAFSKQGSFYDKMLGADWETAKKTYLR